MIGSGGVYEPIEFFFRHAAVPKSLLSQLSVRATDRVGRLLLKPPHPVMVAKSLALGENHLV